MRIFFSGFASDLDKISGNPPETPRGGSPGGLRTISAGTTLLVHTVYSNLGGAIVAEATAHAGWITGMDLAIVSGLLVTASEDGYTRVFFYIFVFIWKQF